MIDDIRLKTNARNLDELILAQLEIEELLHPQVLGYLVTSKEFYTKLSPSSHLALFIERSAYIDEVNEMKTRWALLREQAFRADKQDHSSHNLAPFEGKMMPQLARALINICTGDEIQGAVLDPFCGSGTVLLEGALLEHRVYGGDIDSYAIYLTTEKLKQAKVLGAWSVALADCLTNLKMVKAKAIVTSPPYFNAIDYITRHESKRDQLNLSSPLPSQLGVGQSVTEYGEKVNQIGTAIAEALVPKGRCAIVVGDTQAVPSSLWYEMALKSSGLRMVARVDRPYANPTRGFAKEIILIAEKQ